MSTVLSPDDPTYPGQAHYTRRFLRIYDPLVLGMFARWIWRCPTSRIIDHYTRMLREKHLDIGPGTGFFLGAASATSSITLLDPNPNVLAYCAARLSHLRPTLVEADVTRPLPVAGNFDSVALNYVLHCLPSTGDHKSAAVANAAAVLADDGVLFGSTVLGTPDMHTRLSRMALRGNNRRGIFDNMTDDVGMVSSVLDRSFENQTMEVVGSVAVFSARRPRRA